MRSLKLSSIVISVLCLAPLSLLADNTYTIDPHHTEVEYNINHFGFSNPSGKWMAEGTLEYDAKAPQNSKANITINIGNIITGNPELDKHLKGKQFFEIETFPKATFISDKVNVVDNKITEVSGNLTLHGITHPVTIKVQQNNMGKNPVTDKPTIGFTGEATLKRSDFGIRTFLPNLSDEVKLNLNVEAYKEHE